MSPVRVGRTLNHDREPLPYCPDCRIYWLQQTADAVFCPGCDDELELWP